MEEKKNFSAVFTACHKLTKIIIKSGDDYKLTFGNCLKLYYHDFFEFYFLLSKNDIDDAIVLSNDHFASLDFFGNLSKMDYDFKAEKIVKNAINFACFYGLKKRGSNTDFYSKMAFLRTGVLPVDSVAVNVVDEMKKNDIDDIKQEIFIYLFNRRDNIDFQELPFIVQLSRAGDCVITNLYNKRMKKAKQEAGSLDIMSNNSTGVNDKYFNNCDDIRQALTQNVKKCHRKIAIDVFNMLYSEKGKEFTMQETAEALNISLRTVKSIVKEMKTGFCITDFI